MGRAKDEDPEKFEEPEDERAESGAARKRRPKRPRVHWAMMGLCWLLFLAVWPDDLTGVLAHMRTHQWVLNDPAFNGLTFGIMAWHVVFWGPGILWFSALVYRRKHLGRRLGLALVGGEVAVAIVRLAFLNYLLWVNYWPKTYLYTPLWGSVYWLVLLLVHGMILAYLWAEGHTLNR